MTTSNDYNFSLYFPVSELPSDFNQKSLGEQSRLKKEQESNSRIDFVRTFPIMVKEDSMISWLKERCDPSFLKRPYPYYQKTHIKNPFDRNKNHSHYVVEHNFSNNFTKTTLNQPNNRYGEHSTRGHNRKQGYSSRNIPTSHHSPINRYGPRNGRLVS